MKKIVLTGASGRLGSYLREPLCNRAKKLLSTDINENIGTLYPREEFVSRTPTYVEITRKQTPLTPQKPDETLFEKLGTDILCKETFSSSKMKC